MKAPHITITAARPTAADYAAASKQWEAFRDSNGEGVSTIGNGVPITNENGVEIARVSYNGKVWPAGGYVAGATPLYVP